MLVPGRDQGPITGRTDGGLKEWVGSIMSIAIVAVTLCIMVAMFHGSEHESDETWQRKASILQIAISLAGTVTGYYFGRIPAEKAAVNSQRAAASAQQALTATVESAQKSSENERRIRSRIADLSRRLGAPVGGGKPGESVDHQWIAQQLNEVLRD